MESETIMRTAVSEFQKQAELHPDNIAVLDIQGAITLICRLTDGEQGRKSSCISWMME